MRLFIIALCLASAQAASTYSYAKQCKPQTDVLCIRYHCSGSSVVGKFPYSTLYGCCKGYVFDQRNYVCVLSGGVIRVKSCNPNNQFRCGNGQCVLRSWRCNGVKECRDGSDELGCGSCSSYQFRCKNDRCISRSQVCDKYNHCGDGTDEIGCPTVAGGACGDNHFRCANNNCIPKSYVCDRDNDCKDDSDEKGCQSYRKKREATAAIETDGFAKEMDAATGINLV